mmetsp:Transcript_15458/g.23163  ORF Transcript_15458/g.23163 Transcript_15458/m.23163 type:complete len:240 (+) Transcript_15458:185-904(+)
MVFWSRRNTSPDVQRSSSSQSKSSKKLMFGRKKGNLAYTNIIHEDDDDGNSPVEVYYTAEELTQLNSVKNSKAHVDGVLYRNRKSGRRTLFNRDGVVLFSGFVDWMSRKRTREMKETTTDEGGEGDDDVEGEEAATSMIISYVRVQKIDPVKSGFMGRKSDRDELMGCATGTIAAAHWTPPPCPSEEVKMVGTPQKGIDAIGWQVDDSFATACSSPWSSTSSWNPNFFQEEDCFEWTLD